MRSRCQDYAVGFVAVQVQEPLQWNGANNMMELVQQGAAGRAAGLGGGDRAHRHQHRRMQKTARTPWSSSSRAGWSSAGQPVQPRDARRRERRAARVFRVWASDLEAFKSTICCFRWCPASSTTSSPRPTRCDGSWCMALAMCCKSVDHMYTHMHNVALPGAPLYMHSCTHMNACMHMYMHRNAHLREHTSYGLMCAMLLYGPEGLSATRLPYLGNGPVSSRMALGRRPQH